MCNGINGRDTDEREGGRVTSIAIVASTALLDETLAALAHRRRRYVLYRLRERETSELDELARYVAAVEADAPLAEVDDEECDHVETTLAHSHVPRLDEAGLVDYDPRTRAVRYAHPTAILESVIEVCAGVEAPEIPD